MIKYINLLNPIQMSTKINLHTLFLLGVICMVLLMGSCKKENLPNRPEPSAFDVILEGESSLPSIGGTVHLSIEAGSNGWWIEVPDESKSWCKVSKIYGSGDYSVPVLFEVNRTGQPRSVMIRVNPTFGLEPITVSIKQN